VSAPKKYDEEFRDRAVRMYRDRLAEPGESKLGARRHVGSLLDVNQATLRNWIEERSSRDGTKHGPGAATSPRRSGH
jgi:transposase